MTEKEKQGLMEGIRSSVHGVITEYITNAEDDTEKRKMLFEYPDRLGHYRRPILCVLTAMAFGARPSPELYKLAAALQLSEDWILMLDDMQDKPVLRRGKPPFHAIYGEEHTVNTAAMLQSIMWDMLRDALKRLDSSRADYIWEMFHKIGHSTYNGQTDAVTFSTSIRDLSAKDYRFYYNVAVNKTSEYTLAGPMQLGACFAGKNGDVVAALERIGKPAGVAFQLINDMDDVKKGTFEDLYNSEATLIMLHAYRKASPEERELLAAIYRKDKAEKTKEDIEYMHGLITKYDSLDFAIQMRDGFERVARARIKESAPLIEGEGNPYMALLISTVSDQYKG